MPASSHDPSPPRRSSRRFPRSVPALLVAALALVGGCESNRYRLRLRPEGDSLQRELTAWRERGGENGSQVIALTPDEAAQIAGEYGAATPTAAAKHRFSGLFQQMPQDVGGSGWYRRWETSLGHLSVYVERFRGEDDLATTLQRRRQAASRLAELLAEWLAAETRDVPGAERLRDFLENEFRRDVENLSLYAWISEVGRHDSEHAAEEGLLRAGQYLVERSYVKPDAIPYLVRAVRDAETDDPSRLLAVLQRLVATQMGVPQDKPIPAGLAFLSDVDRLQRSWADHLRETPEYRDALAQWERKRNDEPEAERPDPTVVLEDLASDAVLPAFGIGPADEVEVTLAASEPPITTNGRWDEDDQRVVWRRELSARDADRSGHPALIYAIWSEPDEAAQRQRFGRVLLTGEALAEYALWRRGLEPPEAASWERQLETIDPSRPLAPQFDALRLSAPGAETDLADGAKGLLLGQLGE